jgi:transposase
MARGRPLIIHWHDTAETLSLALRRERSAEVRTRLHAIWLIRQGHTLGAAAELVGAHYVTVQQWVAWYRTGGLDEVRRHRRGGRQGRPNYLSPEQRLLVRDAVLSGHLRTAGEIRDWIAAEFGVTYSVESIYDVLARLKLRLRDVRRRRPQPTPASPVSHYSRRPSG